MSKQIEQRVVQMTFDNDQFEKNAGQTIETLKRLDSTLDSTGKTSSLEKLQNVADNFSMKGVITAVEQTANKYSWFEQIAIGAYRKIGEAATSYISNQFMDITGVNRAITGWQKYETEVEAVQTIMNASGKSMSEVEKYLRKLAIYTDETSYSYDAMVTNIGKFNAAGVKDLNVATNSMMGIANMAGFFGVNATKATHAMEGFAKAIGKGYMDSSSWQWIETAGMNASAIQKAFIDTAVQLGKIEKKGKNLYKVGKNTEFTAEQFKNVLKDKWLDKDVITATLNKYSAGMNDIIAKYDEFEGEMSMATILDTYGDSFDKLTVKAFSAAQETKTFSDAIGALKEVTASGWRQTFRYIFGNYEEAKDLWGGVVEELWDIFAGQGSRRNALLKGWYEQGGRDAFLEGIGNVWQGLKNIVTPIKEAFEEIFPPMTTERLVEFSKKFRDLTAEFKSWFAVFDPEENPLTKTITSIREVTKNVEGPVAKTTKVLEKLANAVWRGDYGNGASKRRKLLEKEGYSFEMVQNRVNELVEAYNKLPKGYYGRYKVIPDGTTKVLEEFTEEVELTAEEIEELKGPFRESEKRAENLKNAMLGLFSAVSLVKDIFKGAVKAGLDFFKMLVKKLQPTFDLFLEIAGTIGEKITEVQKKLKQSNGIQKALNKVADVLSTIIAAVVNNIVPAAKKAFDWVYKIVSYVVRNAYPILQKVYGVAYDIVTNVYKKLTSGQGIGKLKTVIESVWSNVKDIAKNVWEVVKQVGGDLFKQVDKVVRTLVGATEDMSIGEVVALIFDKVADKISDFVINIGKAKDKIVEFFQAFGGKDAEKVETLTASMQTVTSNLSDTANNTLKPVKTVLDDIFSYLQQLGNKLKSPIKAITDAIGGVLGKIVGMFNDLTFEKIGKVLKETGIGVFFGVLAKKIAEGQAGIGSIPQNINKVLIGIYDTLLLYQSNLKGSQLKTAAEAVGILVLAVIGLSAADIDMQKVMDFAAASSLIMFAASMLVGAINTFRKITASKNKNKYEIVGLTEFLQNSKFNVNLANATEKLIKPLETFADNLSKAINKKLNGGQLAKAFLFVSAALAIIVYIIKTIRDEQWDLDVFDSEGNITYFGKILAFIAGLGTVMAILIRVAGGNQTMGAALSFVTAVLALKMVIDTIWEIIQKGVFTPDKISKIYQIALFMGLALTTIAAAIAATSKNIDQFKSYDKKNKTGYSHTTKTGNSPFGIAFALIAYALAFNLMVPAIESIGKLSQSGINNVLGFMFVFGMVVAALSYMTNLTDSKHVKDVSAIAWTMIGAITAIGVLAAVMNGIDGIGGGVLKIVVIMGALAAAIAVAAGAAWLIEKAHIGEALAKLGDGMLKLGVGLAGVGVFAFLFGKAMTDIIDGIVYLGKVLHDPETAENFKEGIAAILLAIVAGIIIYKSHIVKAAWMILEEVGATLYAYIPTMFTKVMDFLLKVVNLITSAKPSIILMVATIIMIFFDVIDTLLPGVVDGLIHTLCVLINSLALTVSKRGGQLFQAILNLIGALIGLIFQAIASVLEAWNADGKHPLAGKIAKMLRDGVEELEGETQKALDTLSKDNDAFEEQIKRQEELQERANGSNQRRKRTTNKGNSNQSNGTTGDVTERNPLEASIGGLFNNVTGGNLDLSGIMNSLTNGKVDLQSAAGEFMSGLPEGMQGGLDLAQMNVDGALGDMISTITGSKPESVAAAQDVVNTTEEEAFAEVKLNGRVEDYLKEAYAAGRGVLEEEKGNIGYYVEINVVQPTLSPLDKLKEEMRKRAAYAIDGFVDEIKSQAQLNRVWSAGSGVTKTFLNAYDVTSMTKSPARTMIWRGLMAIEGFVKGTQDNLGMVRTVGVDIAQSLLGAVSDNLDSTAIHPEITPVLNLDNISNGPGSISRLLNSGPLLTGLSGVTSSLSSVLASDAFTGFNQNQEIKQAQIENLNMRNTDVVSQLQQLRGDVNNLNDAFSNTQVVLDSGALVGATARQMDNALGRINTYRGRGI